MDTSESTQAEIDRLKAEVERLRGDNQEEAALRRTQLARHDMRPYTLDYVERLFQNFSEIHGDRRFGDDPALIAGMAVYHGTPVMIVGHQKGRDIKQRQYRNFGMPQPEGYRKAIRAMKLADKFHRPIICFVDTPGAFPGVGAEERGQAEAIAYNLREMASLNVPVVVCGWYKLSPWANHRSLTRKTEATYAPRNLGRDQNLASRSETDQIRLFERGDIAVAVVEVTPLTAYHLQTDSVRICGRFLK